MVDRCAAKPIGRVEESLSPHSDVKWTDIGDGIGIRWYTPLNESVA